MKIAIVTGASSGMGKEFVRQLSEDYRCLDEIWVISRSRRKLEELRKLSEKRLVILPLDLRKRADQKRLRDKLCQERPAIKILVNGAGVGKIGEFTELSLGSQRSAVRLNCEGLTVVMYLCLPFMHQGSRILMMASASAFLPQPGFAVYSASKAYVLSFARALRAEIRERGITVTAICPGPVDTPFFEKAEQIHRMASYKKSSMAVPKEVVAKAIRDGARGRECSVYGIRMKALMVGAKLIPHRLLVDLTQNLNRMEERD